jgi:hypothetical protein
MKEQSKTAATIKAENKKAAAAEKKAAAEKAAAAAITAAAAAGTIKAKKEPKYVNFPWSDLLAMNKAYNDVSLFKVLAFLNERKEITKVFGKLTIDHLRAVGGEYFFQKRTRKGAVIMEKRQLFKPFYFLKALQVVRPEQLTLLVETNLKFRAETVEVK